MNRRTHTLTSLGISVALIAAGIWLLNNHQYIFGFGNGRWMMPHHMMPGRGGMIMTLFWMAVLTAVALLVSGVIARTGSSNDDSEKSFSEPGALEILKRRYASGEIDKKKYDAMKQDLH